MLRFVAGVAVGVWLSVWVAACGSYPVRGDSFGGLERYHREAAFMSWNCLYDWPVGFVRIDQLKDEDELEALLAHEASHVADAVAMGCEAWGKWRLVEGNQLLTEVRAFCAELAVRVEQGRDESFWREAYARNLMWYDWEEQELTVSLARSLMEGCEL